MLNKISIALLATASLSGCVLEDDDKNENIQLTLGEVKNGVAEIVINVNNHEDLLDSSIQVSPLMDMVEGMQHGTPFSNSEGQLDENGHFATTAYFLMPSKMNADSEKMGDWSINVELDGKTTNLPIEVIGMSDMQKLQGDTDDKIMNMDGTESNRTYYIFNRQLKSMAATSSMEAMSSLEVYIAARETMMKYSAITQSTTLNAGDNHSLAITEVGVTMCIDACDNSANWKVAEASSEQDGVYTGSFMAEAINGIQVKLEINNIEKLKGDGGIASFSASTMMMDM